MPLTGTFQRAIDEKQRIAVPKTLREGLDGDDAGEMYLAPGNEGCLSLYSRPGFERLASRLSHIPSGHSNVRNYLRLLYSQAERVVLDKQSRIRVPDRLAQLAGLARSVVLIGVHDHVEIWDQDRWDLFLDQNESQFDELTKQALDGAASDGVVL